MTSTRLCSALSVAFAALTAGWPAVAARFDGSWSMVAETTSGHCGLIEVGFGINRGRIYSTGGSFASYSIRLGGSVTASGRARIAAVAGPRIARGTGRFGRQQATGTWSGTGPSGLCSGVWSASRS